MHKSITTPRVKMDFSAYASAIRAALNFGAAYAAAQRGDTNCCSYHASSMGISRSRVA